MCNPLFSKFSCYVLCATPSLSGNRWALSLSLLEGSPLRRLEMTVVGSSAAISACASGPWQRALWLFDEWLGCDFFSPGVGQHWKFFVKKLTWKMWNQVTSEGLDSRHHRLQQRTTSLCLCECGTFGTTSVYLGGVLEQLFWFFFRPTTDWTNSQTAWSMVC